MAGRPAQPEHAGSTHLMLHFGKWLLGDLLSTVAFVASYAATRSIYLRLRRAPIDLMQWLGLFLVTVLGGATLLVGSPILIMLKPTLIYAVVGGVMLRPGWMCRYAPPVARERAGDLLRGFGYAWAALLFATSAANLGFAVYASAFVWSWCIVVFPVASKLVLAAVQYAVIRATIRRRLRAPGSLTYPSL